MTQRGIISPSAGFSAAITYTKWIWVWLKQHTDLDPVSIAFKKNAVVSAQLNSNLHIWLVKQCYQIAGSANDVRMLFTLLNSRRVDAIMLPERTAKAMMQKEKLDPSLYSMQLEMQLLFGIYISKAYIARNPDIMPKLNQAIMRYHVEQKELATKSCG